MKRLVVMVGPRPDAKGGTARVIAVYGQAGLFGEHDGGLVVRLHPSTIDGSAAAKLGFALRQLASFLVAPLPRGSIVHVHCAAGPSFWRKAAYARLARWKGARVLLHVHPIHFLDFFERGGALRRRAIRSTIALCEMVIVLTESVAGRYRSLALAERIVPVPNPVDLGEFRIGPAPRRREETVVYVGWFVPEKGAQDLLDAIARLRGGRPGLRAVFAGYKGERELRDRVRALGLESTVEIAGWLGRAETIGLLRSCTLIALPSHSEGVPMVLLEAMACGTPIVTCGVGGIPDIVREDRNALYVQPGDVAGLSVAIGRLLDHPELRDEMSRANLEDVRRYDATAVEQQLLGIYREL
ncbi:MAG TPA: glycosyltransferase family 4 protein [Terriglobales bacterium]|nr:glycosyltransferase family 4 protein [Terriglobales bacterium]